MIRCNRSAVGARSSDEERAVDRVGAQAATRADTAQRGRRRRGMQRRGLLEPDHLSGKRCRVIGHRRVARVAGHYDQRSGTGEKQCAGIPVAALGNSSQDFFGGVVVGDTDDPIVGRCADVGVHQPVLFVGRGQHDVHQPAVAGGVDRDDGFHLGFGADGHLFDRAGRPLGNQSRFAVGLHEQAAGALQAALHHSWRRAFLGEWLVGQRRWRRWRRTRRRLAFGIGGERLRLNIVELGATSQNEHCRAEHSRTAPPRPPQPHICQITDMSVAVPVTGTARHPPPPANNRPTRDDGQIGTPKAAPKSPIPRKLPLP